MTGERTLGPSAAWRARVVGTAGVVAGLFVVALYARQQPGVISDWDPTWVATTALLRGESPYAAIQVPPWPNWLLYPLPALLVTAPFTFIPAAPGAGALRRPGNGGVHLRRSRAAHRWTLYFLISGAMLWSWMVVQWAPLLIAAALTPALSWLLRGQAHAGFALWTGWPNRKAVIGGLLFVGISLLVRPDVDSGVAGVGVEDAARTAPAPAGGLSVAAGSAPVAASGGTTARGARRHAADDRALRDLATGAAVPGSTAGRRLRHAYHGGPSALPARPARPLAGGRGIPVVGAAGARVRPSHRAGSAAAQRAIGGRLDLGPRFSEDLDATVHPRGSRCE